MRAFFASVLLGSLALFGPAESVNRSPAVPTRPGLAPPREVAPPPHRPWDYRQFRGTVTAVERDSITVQGIAWEIEALDVRSKPVFDERLRKSVWESVSGKPFIFKRPGGPAADMPAIRVEGTTEVVTVTAPDWTVTVIRRVDQIPKRFAVSDWLAGGGFDPVLRHTDVYPLSAVRVGDLVWLWICQSDEKYECCGISIQRRPGGQVPPSWGEKPNDTNKHYERMQVYQDWEEKGVPLPYAYHPGGPWPQLAPPPREVSR